MEEEIEEEDFCQREIKLCEENNLEIDDYIAIKEMLIRTGLHQGYVDKSDFMQNVNLKDKNLLEKIIDLHEEFDLVFFKNK